MTEEEKYMTTRSETLACADARPPRIRFSLARLLKIVTAMAVALVLMYAEIWAIQEVPLESTSDVSPASATAGETDGPLRDTAGPIAVLH
jgi:hypothetical protein